MVQKNHANHASTKIKLGSYAKDQLKSNVFFKVKFRFIFKIF